MSNTTAHIYAQKNDKKISITGTVLDIDKSPVANAMVIIDGNKTNVLTDAMGNYKIKVKRTALKIGIVTFGNGIIEEEIDGRTLIDFNFSTQSVQHPEPNVAPARETVNVGYGKVKKKNLTHSVSKIDGAGSNKTYTSIYDMLRQASGVEVHGKLVIIQDSRDIFGHVPPLFVVDGVPVESIDDISPSTVESIEVLKGTSAAIYGSRGYGGVILITLKTFDETK
jgi:TonB-dependent SusC/RagA subfamily outer membrane receptor